MKIELGKYVLHFGRLPNEPQRSTLQDYYNLFPFAFITKQKTELPKPNVRLLRNLGKNPIIRMVINLIKDNILKRKWRLVNIDSTDTNEYTNEKSIVQSIIKNPNGEDDYDSFWGATLEDSLVGDCFTFEKAKGGNIKRPLFLFPVDGMTIDMVLGSHTYKYSQVQGSTRKYFTSDQVAYIKRTNRTDNPFGFSPLEAIFQYVSALTNTFEYSSEVASNALPKYALNLVGQNVGNKLDEVRQYFVNDCMGENSLPIFNAEKAESVPIAPISEDACFIKYQTFIMTFVVHEFGVPAEFVGLEKANDRSTFEEKYSQFVENALKPYAKLLEKAINKHVIEPLGFADKFRFEFVWEETLEQRKTKQEMVVTLYQGDLITGKQACEMLEITPPDDEWIDERITVYKAKVNEKFQINGFGSTKDGYGDKQTTNKGNTGKGGE